MSTTFSLFLVFWGVVLITLIGIGGFFMFRKFLKQLPKADGKSDMDWQEYFIDETRHMWDDDGKNLLEDLVSPVPELFRDVARQTIAGKIGEVALNKQVDKITLETIIEGYIIGTPKKDHRFLRKRLHEMDIDVAPYEPFFKMSKDDYRQNWKERNKLKTR